MMKSLKRIFFPFVACTSLMLGLTMCTENTPDLSDVAIFVTPGASEKVEMLSGDKYRYEVDMSTIHDYVASLKVVSFDRLHGETVCFEETYSSPTVKRSVVYEAPETDRETLEVELRFIVTDNLGNKNEVNRKVRVVGRMVALPEKTGIVLYGPQSGMPDALSLADVSRPFCLADAPDPDLADIHVVAPADFSTVDWRSNTEAKFVRVNTFNYVEATPTGINQVYRSSVPQDVVADLHTNDIIIVGHGSEADGVFRIVNILRDFGGVSCMELSYKGIAHTDTPEKPETPDNPEPNPDESDS